VYVAATYLRRSPGWARARRFSKWNRHVEAQLVSTPGALAYALQRLLIGRDFWTLSLWANRESMVQFVESGDHRRAADWLNSTGESQGKFAQWESAVPTLDFHDAYAHLGLPPPHGRALVAPTRIPEGWRGVPL
jgi:hypothetical protein